MLLGWAPPLLCVIGWPMVTGLARSGSTPATTLPWTLHAAIAYALGSVLAQMLAVALMATHQLTSVGVAVASTLVLCGAVVRIGFDRKRGLELAHTDAWTAWQFAFFCCCFVATFCIAWVTPWFRDELTYHTVIPQQNALAAAFGTQDGNIFFHMPAGYEAVLSLAYAAVSDVNVVTLHPRLLSAWSAVFAALACAGALEIIGARLRLPMLNTWSFLSGVALLSIPVFFEYASMVYVESTLLVFSTLAMVCVLQIANDAPGARFWTLVGGICAGAAASLKFHGLAVCVWCAVAIALSAPPKQRWRTLLTFIMVGALVGAPHYARAWRATDNPLFPVGIAWLGGRGWDTERDAMHAVLLSRFGYGRTALDWLLLVPRMMFDIGTKNPFEGALNLHCALGVPIAVATVSMRKRLSPSCDVVLLSWFVVSWLVFWAWSTQQMRFFLVCCPALLLLVAIALASAAPSRITRLGILMLAVSCVVIATVHVRFTWRRHETSAALAGRSTSQQLHARLPDVYAAYAATNAVVPPGDGVWLVWARAYAGLLTHDVRVDEIFEGFRFEQAMLHMTSCDAFVRAQLSERRPFVLIDEPRFFAALDDDGGRAQLVRDSYARCVNAGAFNRMFTLGRLTLLRLTSPAP